jgi:hypothetical protein
MDAGGLWIMGCFIYKFKSHTEDVLIAMIQSLRSHCGESTLVYNPFIHGVISHGGTAKKERNDRNEKQGKEKCESDI